MLFNKKALMKRGESLYDFTKGEKGEICSFAFWPCKQCKQSHKSHIKLNIYKGKQHDFKSF